MTKCTRLLSIAAAVALLALPLQAQIIGGPQTITVIDSGTRCVTAPAACAFFALDNSTAGVTLSLSGTFTGTFTFEGSNNNGVWTSILVTDLATGARVTSTTTAGLYGVGNAGLIQVGVRATAAVTGAAVVSAARGSGLPPASAGLVLAGNGATLYRPAGFLFTPITADTSNAADTNYKCVALGTVAANTFTKVGDQLTVEFEFLNAAGVTVRTFNLNIGGTCAADATGFTGGFTFYTATNATTIAQTTHTAKLICSASCTGAATFKGSGGYITTQASGTGGSAFASGSATVSSALALALDFKDSASVVNTLKNAQVMFRPAP